MANLNWSKGYSPAEAERGKFVAIDNNTITNYPSGGRGKFATIVAPIQTQTPEGFLIPTYDTVVYGYTSTNKISSEMYFVNDILVAHINKFYDGTGTNMLSATKII